MKNRRVVALWAATWGLAVSLPLWADTVTVAEQRFVDATAAVRAAEEKVKNATTDLSNHETSKPPRTRQQIDSDLRIAEGQFPQAEPPLNELPDVVAAQRAFDDASAKLKANETSITESTAKVNVLGDEWGKLIKQVRIAEDAKALAGAAQTDALDKFRGEHVDLFVNKLKNLIPAAADALKSAKPGKPASEVFQEVFKLKAKVTSEEIKNLPRLRGVMERRQPIPADLKALYDEISGGYDVPPEAIDRHLPILEERARAQVQAILKDLRTQEGEYENRMRNVYADAATRNSVVALEALRKLRNEHEAAFNEASTKNVEHVGATKALKDRKNEMEKSLNEAKRLGDQLRQARGLRKPLLDEQATLDAWEQERNQLELAKKRAEYDLDQAKLDRRKAALERVEERWKGSLDRTSNAFDKYEKGKISREELDEIRRAEQKIRQGIWDKLNLKNTKQDVQDMLNELNQQLKKSNEGWRDILKPNKSDLPGGTGPGPLGGVLGAPLPPVQEPVDLSGTWTCKCPAVWRITKGKTDASGRVTYSAFVRMDSENWSMSAGGRYDPQKQQLAMSGTDNSGDRFLIVLTYDPASDTLGGDAYNTSKGNAHSKEDLSRSN